MERSWRIDRQFI